MRSHRCVAVLLGAFALFPSIASARCGLAAHESAVYGYYNNAGSRCTTLEEAEAEMRGGLMPLAANAFLVPAPFDRQPVVGSIDYRPHGALGTQAGILIGPPAPAARSAYVMPTAL